MNVLRWLRVIGDTIFALGVMGFGWFVVGLKTGWSVSQDEESVLEQSADSPFDRRAPA
jgi:nitric oxide reductase subunit B